MSGVRTADAVLAHGIGGRADLPVPLWLAMYAGAVAVLVSFFAVLALWSHPRLRGADAGLPVAWVEKIALSGVTDLVLRVVGVLALAAFLISAWFGPDDEGRANPAPTWIYVWFWVGLVPLSLVFGPLWRRMNPLRTIAAGISGVARIRPALLAAGLAYWPAIAGLLLFLWFELVYDEAASPRAVGAFVTAYAVIHIGAGVRYGNAWFARADGFEVYATMIARAAPLGRRSDGRLVLRNPLDGLAGTPSTPDLTPVVLIVLGSTAFDGLSRTPLWSGVIAGTGRAAYLALGTAGLFGTVLLVAATYGLAIRTTRRFTDESRGLQAEFAPTIIPVAIGYTVAHYFSFAVFQGQQGVLLATDPLATGWDLLGLAGETVNYTVIPTWGIATVQVGAIIVGHVVAVVSAHDKSVAVLPERNGARGQYPLLVLMVIYTVSGIALLSGA